jgi:hypothetical protein
VSIDDEIDVLELSWRFKAERKQIYFKSYLWLIV